jgi:hypothetical protein
MQGGTKGLTLFGDAGEPQKPAESPVIQGGFAMQLDSTAVAHRSVSAGLDDLVARVERIIRCRTGGRVHDLRVDADDSSVVLSGVCSTYYAKQLATHAALDELGGHTLTNEIEVV